MKVELTLSQRILQTAREIITEEGYSGLTMRTLATRAGVALQTLYNLYNNKDELILEAINELMQMRAAEAIHYPEHSIERLLEAMDRQSTQIEQTPRYADAITRALLQASPRDALARMLIHDGHAELRRMLERMQRLKQLKEGVDIEHALRLLDSAPWGPMLIWQKGYIELADLRRTQRDQVLAVLVSLTRGKVHRQLEERLLQGADAAEMNP